MPCAAHPLGVLCKEDKPRIFYASTSTVIVFGYSFPALIVPQFTQKKKEVIAMFEGKLNDKHEDIYYLFITDVEGI